MANNKNDKKENPILFVIKFPFLIIFKIVDFIVNVFLVVL